MNCVVDRTDIVDMTSMTNTHVVDLHKFKLTGTIPNMCAR